VKSRRYREIWVSSKQPVHAAKVFVSEASSSGPPPTPPTRTPFFVAVNVISNQFALFSHQLRGSNNGVSDLDADDAAKCDDLLEAAIQSTENLSEYSPIKVLGIVANETYLKAILTVTGSLGFFFVQFFFTGFT
jgi:hypothetical protein